MVTRNPDLFMNEPAPVLCYPCRDSPPLSAGPIINKGKAVLDAFTSYQVAPSSIATCPNLNHPINSGSSTEDASSSPSVQVLNNNPLSLPPHSSSPLLLSSVINAPPLDPHLALVDRVYGMLGPSPSVPDGVSAPPLLVGSSDGSMEDSDSSAEFPDNSTLSSIQ